MKKLLLLFLVFIIFNSLSLGQLLTENYSFTGNLTANLIGNIWTAHSGGGTNPIATTTGLTYSGYIASGVGNAALVSNLSGEDDNTPLSTPQNTNGAVVYMAAMINVTEVAITKTGDYFLMLGNRTAPATLTLFASRVFAKITASGVNFGLSNTSTATYGTTNFSKNTTYLLIVKYVINTAGVDETKLWILPSTVPIDETAAGTPEVTNTTTAGQDIINCVALRQGSATTSPTVVVDGIRVAITWTDAVTQASTPTVSINKSSLAFGSILVGNTSAEETYNVSGSNLTADITVTAPSGYLVSKVSGGPFTSSVTVAQSRGIVATTPIYAIFSPGTTGSFTGNITNTSTGASTQNVAVTGNGVTNYYSTSSGNLELLATWGTSLDGTGTNPTDFTSNYQVFNIINNRLPTIGSNWIVSGTGSKIVLGDGTNTVNFTIPSLMTVTGTIDLSANGTLILQNATLSHTYGTINLTSTIKYAQAGNYVVPTTPTTYGNLTLTGGTKSFSAGTYSVLGNLTVDGVTDFDGAGTPFTTINLSKDFILLNGTTFISAVANRFTLVCLGALAQTLQGNGNSFNLFRITVSNSSGVSLSTTGGSSNVTVGNTTSGGVTMSSGNLTTNSNAVLFYNAAGPSILTEAAGKYIIGNVVMTKTVGLLASVMGGCGVSIAAGADDIGDVTITRVTGTSGIVSANGNNGISRKWSISSTNPLPAGRDITFTWVSSDDNSKTLTSGTAWKSTNSGTSWELLASGDYSARSVIVPGEISFGDYTFSDAASPLPVELTSFSAIEKNKAINLVWQTATEVNNYGFEIQRSSDKTNWNKIGFVAGAGNSNTTHKYSFVDNNIVVGTSYYRLKQTDIDGISKYHEVVSINVDKPINFSLDQNYPNPFNPSTIIRYSIPKETKVELFIYSITGELVKTLVNEVQQEGYYNIPFNASDLASGLYIYQLRAGEFMQIHKMSLIK